MSQTPPESSSGDAITVNGGPSNHATVDTGSSGDSLVRAVLGMGRRPAPAGLVPDLVIDDTYRIVRTLGIGGMGVVYLARDLRLGRDVAIKLHATGATARGVERLMREASAIAQLSHVNVVTVYQVDTYDGHPFVAMEYVDGGTARSWLHGQPRSWREIVALYVAAGRGLAAAHRAGLVHRDFKPDNVLVGRDGRVRVADFGLVQGAVPSSDSNVESTDDGDDAPADAGPLTKTGAVMGTPAYMAPEQHRAASIGPAADQFSFCVALWEALYGERPFAGTEREDIAAAIEAGKLREPAADRKVPRRLRRALERGLSADARARFPSMDEVLHELARDPAARRRQLAIALATLAVAGGGGAAWALSRDDQPAAARCADAGDRLAGVWDDARRSAVEQAFLATGKPHAAETFTRTSAQLDRYASGWVAARTEACQATHVRGDQSPQLLDLRYHCLDQRRARLGALVEVFTAGPDPQVLDRAITASLGLDDLAECEDIPTLSGALPRPADPAARAEIERLESAVADIHAMLASGKFKEGVALAQPTVEAARATAYPPLIAQALRVLASAQSSAGAHVVAKATAREAALASAEAHDDRGAAVVWIFLLHLLATRTNEIDEAEGLVPVTEAAVARAGSTPALQLELTSVLGVLRQEQGRYPEARTLLESALAIADRELGPDDPDTANTLNRLANVLSRQDALDDARRYLERAIDVQQRMLGAEHPYLAMSLHNLGGVIYRTGDYQTARGVFERALAMKEKLLGADHPDVAGTQMHLGVTLRSLGQYQEARTHLERALTISEASFSAEHPSVARCLVNLAGVNAALGNSAEAVPQFERALALLEKSNGPNHPDLATSLIELGNVRNGLGDIAGARRDIERARAILEATVGPEHPDVAAAIGSLADLLVDEGKLDQALREYEKALAITIAARGEAHPQVPRIRSALGFLSIESGDYADARRHLAAATAGFEITLGAEHPEVARCLYGQAKADLRTHDDAAAQALLERAIAIIEKASGVDHPSLTAPLTALAQAHLYQGHAAEAVTAADRSVAIHAARPKDPRAAAEARFVAAQAHWLAGPDQKGALADARAARTALVAAGGGGPSLRDMDVWLRNPRR